MRRLNTIYCCMVWLCCGSHPASLSRPDGGTSSKSDTQDGGSVGHHAPERICDGSQSLRLRIYQASNPVSNLRASAVRIENGFPSFAVDGQCNYYLNAGWMNTPLGRDEGWRFGVLPGDARDALDSVVNLSNLPELQDCLSDATLFDVDPWVVSSSAGKASCKVPGPNLSRALAIIEARASVLWSNASEMNGPIRFSATTTSDDGSIRYQWPLDGALASTAIPENVSMSDYKGYSVGVSNLVADSEGATKLRQLRKQYIADRTAIPGRFSDGQLMSDGTTVAFIYMRDALPYEKEDGLWPF